MAAAQTCATLTAHRVNLINEDDGGHRLFGLLKQVTHAGRADADIHLHKIRAGNGVERHTGLTRTGAGQQRLAGTRRADKQDTVGNPCAQRVEFVGSLQELDNLL